MPDIAVDHLVMGNQVDKGGSTISSLCCSLEENAGNEEEEDQALDVAQLCLKAELATVLADQVEMLREKNAVLSQTVIITSTFDS